MPVDVAASVIVLRALQGLSDRDAVAALRCDLRWKVACGLAIDDAAFHPTTLTYWRRRLRDSEQPNRIFEAVRQVVAGTGVAVGEGDAGVGLDGARRRCRHPGHRHPADRGGPAGSPSGAGGGQRGRRAHARAFFESLVTDNLGMGRPDEISLIFDRRIQSNTDSGFATRVVTRGVDATVNFVYQHSRIKEYLEEGRALRVETVVNSPTDLGCHRRLQMSYDLARLRAKGLIERVDHTNTYRLTPDGQRVAIFYTKVHDRLLRPRLAAHAPPAPPELRAALHTIDRHVADYTRDAHLKAT